MDYDEPYPTVSSSEFLTDDNYLKFIQYPSSERIEKATKDIWGFSYLIFVVKYSFMSAEFSQDPQIAEFVFEICIIFFMFM